MCVHDDKAQATARAVQIFAGYGQLPNYRRQLDAEGLNQAGEIAVVGNEDNVRTQLQGEGAPGPRGQGFYGGYFRDMDGHKLNFFCITGG